MTARPLLAETWFTKEELADRLHVTVKTLQGWRHSGKGPKYMRIGNGIQYPESAVNDWLNGKLREKAKPTPAAPPPPKKPPERLNKRNTTRAEKRYLLGAKAASNNLQ